MTKQVTLANNEPDVREHQVFLQSDKELDLDRFEQSAQRGFARELIANITGLTITSDPQHRTPNDELQPEHTNNLGIR